jgi:hypothetical protein
LKPTGLSVRVGELRAQALLEIARLEQMVRSEGLVNDAKELRGRRVKRDVLVVVEVVVAVVSRTCSRTHRRSRWPT